MKTLHVPVTNSYLEFVFSTWKSDPQASPLIGEDSQETDIPHQLTIKLTWVEIMTHGDEFNAFLEYARATNVRNQNDKIIRWQKVLAFKQKCLNKTYSNVVPLRLLELAALQRRQNTFYQIRKLEFEANTLSCHSPANIPVELSLLNKRTKTINSSFSFFYRLKRNQTAPTCPQPQHRTLSSCTQNLLAGLGKYNSDTVTKKLL